MTSDSWEGGCCPMFPWCYVRWYSHGVVSVICPVMFPWWADDQHRVATPRLHIRWAKPRWVIRTVMSGDKQMRMFCNITLTCWCNLVLSRIPTVAAEMTHSLLRAAAGSRNEWRRWWGGLEGSLRSPATALHIPRHSGPATTPPCTAASNRRLEGGIQFVNKLLIDGETATECRGPSKY